MPAVTLAPEPISKLLAKRQAILDEGAAVLKAAELGGRPLTANERTRLKEIKGEDDKITAQVDDLENDEALRAWIKGGHDELGKSAGRITPHEAGAALAKQVAPEQKPFDSFGHFLQAVASAGDKGHPAGRDQRLKWERFSLAPSISGMSETAPSDGGFLVQRDFSSELLKRTYDYGEILSRIRTIPISENANGLKINRIDEQSRVNGSRWGGLQIFWQSEADTPAAKKPKFAQMELNLKKLIGLCYATDELLQDAAALEAIIMQGFSEEFSFVLEDSVFNGVGSGQMLGIFNGPCIISVAKETGQATKTVVKENVDKMWSRCWGRSRRDAVWCYNQDVEPQLYGMAIAVGTGGFPVFLPPGGLSATPFATIYGRPAFPVEYAATLGTVGDIGIYDFSQYLAIDKGKMQTAASVHVRFINDETTFRFVYRVDGQPIWNSVLTPKNGTNTLAPFVNLAAR